MTVYPPATSHQHSGLGTCLDRISEAMNWQSEFNAALKALQAASSGNGSMADLIAAQQKLAALMSPSNQIFQELDQNNPAMDKLIKSANTVISSYLNTFQLHVDGSYVDGDYPGYDFVMVIYNPHGPDTPITFAEFMKGVNSNSPQDVRIEWQDGQGDWAYKHGTMAQMFQAYESHVKLEQGANSAAANAALQDLINSDYNIGI